MTVRIAGIDDLRAAAGVVHAHVSPTPLIRSYALERVLGLPPGRTAWLKDYGWTPVGSFKVLGALCWVARNADRIGERPIAAHSSGNFAAGIAFAGRAYGKRVIVVMPDAAPKVKFDLTRSFGAEIRTYDIARDHETGDRDRLTRTIAEQEGAVQASPYDDADVIAGNGVGGLEIVEDLTRQGRSVSHFFCQVSGGGLMAGHALALASGFPDAEIVGVEPEDADDFRRSMAAGERTRLDHPTSICDGLLSYDVGEHNWPILRRHVTTAAAVTDLDVRRAMKWIDDAHGLRVEPSGAAALAAAIGRRGRLDGSGDVVVVVSGRNVDAAQFQRWTADVERVSP